MKQQEVQQIEVGKCLEVAEPEPLPRDMAKRKPAKVFRHGACSACVFFNPVQRSNGETVQLPSVSFAKLYAKHGLLRSTSSLRPEDLPAAILVLGQAYEWLKQLGREEEEVMWHG